MSFRPGDKSELKTDMTFHFMPALWFDDWGIEISESIRIDEGGGDPLCRTPRRLFIKS